VASYLEATLGLSFTGPRRARLLAGIQAQCTATGLTPADYLAAATRPGPVFDRLVAEVTVGETFFFRDRVQVDLLRDVVLPTLGAGAGRRIAVWSAGCAGGEEAFTLAALAEESGLGDRCSVVGTDASRQAVAKAERASYGAWSMRATTAAEQAAHFHEHRGAFRVADRLRERTRFLQRNLLDGPPPPGRFDLVLCRNLLIYLTPSGVRRAAEVLTDALAPDGWLLTAAGDPPLAAEGLAAVRTPGGLVYRRQLAGAAIPGTARPAVPRPPRAVPAPARQRSRRGAPPRTPAPAPEPVPQPAASAATLAAEVRALGDAGDLTQACRAAASAVRAHPLDVELHYLAGVVLLEAGRLEEAAAAAASAVYLDPQLPATHLLLGQVEHARGNTQRARRSFRNGSRQLAAAPPDAPVALVSGVPAAHLAALATHYLSTGADR
jgi:chemotaxis protein methyltransferase CheR